MEAKDTVVRRKCHCEQLYKVCGCSCDACGQAKIINREREAQAKISFKAGEDKGYAQARNHCEDILLPQERQAGIKEVVDWIDYLIIGIDGCKFEERLDGDKGCIVLDMNENQWRAKCKEWGLQENK